MDLSLRSVSSATAPEVSSPAPSLSPDSPVEPEDRFSSCYQIPLSLPFRGRLFAPVSRLWANGLNLEEVTRVDGNGLFCPGFFSFANPSIPVVPLSFGAPLEDWERELDLVYVYWIHRHTNALWDNLLANSGFKASEWPLKRLFSKDEPPPPPALRKLYAENFPLSNPLQLAVINLGATMAQFAYFEKSLKSSMEPCAQFTYLAEVFGRLTGLMEFFKGMEVDIIRPSATQPLINMASSTEEDPLAEFVGMGYGLMEFLMEQMSKLENDESAQGLAAACFTETQSFHRQRTGFLKFEDGSAYTLKERLAMLDGSKGWLLRMATLMQSIGSVNGNLNLDSQVRSINDLQDSLSALLRKQTLGVQFTMNGNSFGRLTYDHELKGRPGNPLSLHGFGRFEFGGLQALKAGASVMYQRPIAFNGSLQARMGPSIHGGYEIQPSSLLIGGRMDAQLAYDWELSQRLGISLTAGVALGGQLGTGRSSDVSLEGNVGLEVFRY